MILSKRGILQATASMRARRGGKNPSGFSPSPAQPCACLPVTTAHEGASTGALPATRKYHLIPVAPVVALGVAVGVAVLLAVCVALGVAVGVAVLLAVCVALDVAVGVAVLLAVCVAALGVAVGVAVLLPVCV